MRMDAGGKRMDEKADSARYRLEIYDGKVLGPFL